MLKTISENNELVSLLERQLKDARAGKIIAVGIVVVTPQGIISQYSCGPPHLMVTGTAQLQRQLLDAIYTPMPQVTKLSS